MLLKPDRSDFILAIIKEVEAHEAISHLKLMKNNEVNNKHKKTDCKRKTILSIWYFNHNIFPYGRSMKNKSRLCAYEGIQPLGFK